MPRPLPPELDGELFRLRGDVRQQYDVDLTWRVFDDFLEIIVRGSPTGRLSMRYPLETLPWDHWQHVWSDVCERIRVRVPRRYYGPDGATPNTANQNFTATEVLRRQREWVATFPLFAAMNTLSDDTLALLRTETRGLAADRNTGLTPLCNPSNEADVKAEALLVKNLSDEQRAEWAKSKFFMVTGGTTGVRYKLTMNRTYGIETFLYDRKIGILCVVTKDNRIPLCDQLLAQKLLIETDEKAFVALANVVA